MKSSAMTSGTGHGRFSRPHPEWDKPGYAAWASRAHRDSAEPFISIYYRIRIDRVTGHKSTRDAISSVVPASPNGRRS